MNRLYCVLRHSLALLALLASPIVVSAFAQQTIQAAVSSGRLRITSLVMKGGNGTCRILSGAFLLAFGKHA